MKFWHKQEAGQPLFPDIEWNKPERRSQAGKLGIIGGNKLGFLAVADSYQEAAKLGVGEVKVLLPNVLKKAVPAAMSDILFAPTNPSGSLSNNASADVTALRTWADVLLLIGDAGKNSQTAIVYETLLKDSHQPIVITRDAIDLVQNSFSEIIDNPHVVMVASFAQIQKLFRAVYYPKILTFHLPLAQFVDILHKFTVTYPLTICVFHSEHLLIAHSGEVVTQPWTDPTTIWRGTIGTKIASYLVWSPEAPLAAASAAMCQL